MTHPIEPSRIILTSVEERSTLQLGHIWINGQRYKVTIEGSNLNEHLDDNAKMTTLAKAHMIAKAKFKDIKEIQSATVELNKTSITTKAGTQESAVDEEIQDEDTLTKGAKLQSGSSVVEPTKEYFTRLKGSIDKGTDTTLKCSHVFNSIIVASSITLPTALHSSSTPTSTSTSTPPAVPSTLSSGLLIEREGKPKKPTRISRSKRHIAPPSLPIGTNPTPKAASATVPPIRRPVTPPLAPSLSGSPSSESSDSPIVIDSRPVHVQVIDLLKLTNSQPVHFDTIKNKYATMQKHLSTPSSLLKQLIANCETLKNLVTQHNRELEKMNQLTARMNPAKGTTLPGAVESTAPSKEEQTRALKEYKDFLNTILLPQLEKEALILNRLKTALDKSSDSHRLLDAHIAYNQQFIKHTTTILSQL